MEKSILIVGSSHLAFRVGKKLRARNVVFSQIPSKQFIEETLEKSDLEHAKEVLNSHGAAITRAVCLLNDSDAQNINLLLAALAIKAQGRIFVAITNENLIEHIAAGHPSVHVFNPHAIAATTFADAVHGETHVHPKDGAASAHRHYLTSIRTDRIIRNLLILFAGVIAAGTVFFRWSEGASWSDSAYLISTLVSGFDFEDAFVHNYTTPMKITRTVLILSVQFFTLVAFSLIVDRIIKRRTAILEFGRKRYVIRDHVIVCGLGRAGFHIAMELLRRNEKVVVIELNDENRFLHIVRAAGAKVLIGDASLAKNLVDADVAHAAGLVSAISDDLRNLEIGLNARSLRKDVRLILRIFDREIAEEMKTQFNVHFAYSTSTLAALHLVALLTEPTATS
ncbi:MAG: NAD(P)-binding protein [Candidatus Uhrbacteria bacterium]